MRALRLLVGLLVGLLLALALASSATAKAYILRPTGFSPNGETIEGWQWLRKLDHSATWTFDLAALQSARQQSGSVWLNLTPLITNGLNGGSGFATAIPVTLTYTTPQGPKVTKVYVGMKNTFKPLDPEYSGGIGYQCYGQSLLPWSKWKGATALTVTTSASKTLFNRYHFAVNREAAFIGYSK